MSDKKTPVEIPADPEQAQALLARLQQAKKLCGLLGIAQKAGKVTAGTNLVTEAIRSGSPKKCPYAVFLASDASENTKKRVTNCCTFYEIPMYRTTLTTAEIGGAIGKSGSISVVGITDSGLSEALSKLI